LGSSGPNAIKTSETPDSAPDHTPLAPATALT
jgi:hypothetical protein